MRILAGPVKCPNVVEQDKNITIRFESLGVTADESSASMSYKQKKAGRSLSMENKYGSWNCRHLYEQRQDIDNSVVNTSSSSPPFAVSRGRFSACSPIVLLASTGEPCESPRE